LTPFFLLGSDFYTHPVGKIILPILQSHDRERFEINVYHDGKKTESLTGHLRTMASVDLALDSFPYQGTMTSRECLCVGTPIISCCGDYYAHRATSAMMIRMGLQELVADDQDEYVEIAVELLHNRNRLPSLREEVRHRFAESALTDTVGLARELESVFEDWVR